MYDSGRPGSESDEDLTSDFVFRIADAHANNIL